jgi:uncharacterized protein (DUF433 family)
MSNEYIEKQNQVYRIKGTRVALDSIVYKFQQGRSPESIQDSFPALSLSQVYAAIAYYLDHPARLARGLHRLPQTLHRQSGGMVAALLGC